MGRLMKYSLYLFFLVIGVILGIGIRHYYAIPINNAINIIDVATLVTTVFLAIYIPDVLDRKLATARDKKKLIDQRLDEVKYLYQRLNDIVQTGRNHLGESLEVRNLLDVCESRIKTISLLIDHAKLKVPLQEDIRGVLKLCEEHKNLFLDKDASENKTGDLSVFLKNEERLYNDIDQAITLIILKLSDA